MNYFDKIESKVKKYQKLYYTHPKWAAVKFIFWNIQTLFRFKKQTLLFTPKSTDKLSFAISLTGGLGDYLIAINYLSYLLKYIDKDKTIIDFFISDDNFRSEQQFLLQSFPFCQNIFTIETSEKVNSTYDIQIFLNRLPMVKNLNEEKVKKFAPELLPILQKYKQFSFFNSKLFEKTPYCDSLVEQYSLLNGQKRIQQADLFELLGVKDDFTYDFFKPDIKPVLQKFKLENQKFITINRSVGSAYGKSTKLWPLDNYNQLVEQIKKEYPDYKIVQIGYEPKGIKPLKKCDFNLTNQTDFMEISALLVASRLHIDCEGGLVHLRRALKGGTSIVLFGPTDPAIFGYNKNINIRGNGCPIACEWILNDWTTHCTRGLSPAPCMSSITPEMVFKKIKGVLK